MYILISPSTTFNSQIQFNIVHAPGWHMVVITQLIEKSVRCFATVGQGEGEQIVSIGKGCGTPGFALHELAHVIGIVPQGRRLGIQ